MLGLFHVVGPWSHSPQIWALGGSGADITIWAPLVRPLGGWGRPLWLRALLRTLTLRCWRYSGPRGSGFYPRDVIGVRLAVSQLQPRISSVIATRSTPSLVDGHGLTPVPYFSRVGRMALHLVVGTGDDMTGDQSRPPARRRRARVGGGFDCTPRRRGPSRSPVRPPTWTLPMRVTLDALTMMSAASMEDTRPFVSIIPELALQIHNGHTFT